MLQLEILYEYLFLMIISGLTENCLLKKPYVFFFCSVHMKYSIINPFHTLFSSQGFQSNLLSLSLYVNIFSSLLSQASTFMLSLIFFYLILQVENKSSCPFLLRRAVLFLHT